MQFKFPLRDKDGKEIIEQVELLKALRAEQSGFFPIDADGLWHNGIHFTDDEESQLATDGPIGCIADGEIIAYRLPSTYKQTSIAGVDYPYSNAFTLARHVYETPKGNILVFFSLYMNLLPFASYTTKRLPAYLDGDRTYKVASQATDTEGFAGDKVGIRVRLDASGDVIALLPQGSKLSLKSSDANWRQIDSLLQGKPMIRPGWVWSLALDKTENKGLYTVGNKATDTEEYANNTQGLRMRLVARGRQIAFLPRGTQITLDNASDGNWRKIKNIVSGDPVLAPSWVFEPELEETLSLVNPSHYQVKSSANDVEDDIAPDTKGLRIRLAPSAATIGLLEAGDELILGERQGNWAKIIATPNATPRYKKGWVWLAELDKPILESQYYEVGNAANDRPDFANGVTGINIRLEPNGFLLGLLPKESLLELGTRQNNWAKINTIRSGKPIYNHAWVWVPELDHVSGDVYMVGNKANDTEARFAPEKVGIRMRDLSTRTIVALIPRGTKLELASHSNRWAKVRTISEGEALYPPAWVWVPELDAPKPKQKVFQPSDQAQDQPTFAKGEKGLNMRLEPNGIIVGLLPKETQVKLASRKGNWGKIDKITNGAAIHDLGWVWVPELDRLSESRYRVGNIALDKEPDFAPNITGLRMRHFLSRETLALLPQGTELELEANTGRWAKVRAIHKAIPFYRPSWVWTPELDEAPSQANGYKVGDAANDLQPTFAGSASGLRMRTEPGGDIMAIIPKGVTLEIGEIEGPWARVKHFIKGDAIYTHGWVWTPELNKVVLPSAPDQVTRISKIIKAGDLIGYAGKYHDMSEQNQQRFHLQLFTSDNLPKFMSNPYQDSGGKNVLVIPAQTPLFDQVETDGGMGFEESGISLANDVVISSKPTLEKDSQGIEWIEVNGYSLDNSNEQGWVKKVAAQTASTLKWPGFHTFDTTNETIADIHDRDFFERIFSSYQPPATSPLPMTTIQLAHSNETQQTSLNHSIIRNDALPPSPVHKEQWLDLRVEYFNQQVGNSTHTSEIKASQLQQLNEWHWWDEVANTVRDFPQDRQAYYFHPINFINNIASHPDKYILTSFPSLISLEMLQTVHRGNTLYYREILPYINEYANKYNVNTTIRIAHFLSQIGHESGFIIRDESLKYSVDRMRSIFGRGGARTKLYSNPGRYAYFYKGQRIQGNDVNLGNYVYASRIGNGNESSGDGFRYHGRGMIQLTGRSNYQLYSSQHNRTSPEDKQDFLANPNLVVSNKRYGVESAFVWWQRNNMNREADKTHPNFSSRTSVNSRIKSITRLVNGGYNGLSDRTNNFWKVWKILND